MIVVAFSFDSAFYFDGSADRRTFRSFFGLFALTSQPCPFEYDHLASRVSPPSVATLNISHVHVLDILRENPSIKFIELDGDGDVPPGFDPSAVALQSLGKCTLFGHGKTSLIWFMTVPGSADVSLSKSYPDGEALFPKFENLSVAPELHVLDEVFAVSFSVSGKCQRRSFVSQSG